MQSVRDEVVFAAPAAPFEKLDERFFSSTENAVDRPDDQREHARQEPVGDEVAEPSHRDILHGRRSSLFVAAPIAFGGTLRELSREPQYKAVWIPFALAAVLVVGGLGWFSIQLATRPSCSQIESWDECEEASHCDAAHLFPVEGYQGPAWKCASK